MSRTSPSATPGSTVNIVTWFLMVSSVIATLARILIKRGLHRSFSLDDGALLTSLVSIMVNHGSLEIIYMVNLAV